MPTQYRGVKFNPPEIKERRPKDFVGRFLFEKDETAITIKTPVLAGILVLAWLFFVGVVWGL